MAAEREKLAGIRKWKDILEHTVPEYDEIVLLEGLEAIPWHRPDQVQDWMNLWINRCVLDTLRKTSDRKEAVAQSISLILSGLQQCILRATNVRREAVIHYVAEAMYACSFLQPLPQEKPAAKEDCCFLVALAGLALGGLGSLLLYNRYS